MAFTAELIDAGIAGSIGTVGDALDNALCESTIGLFKTEAINLAGPAWIDRREVKWQVARWIHWYNTDRLHSSIEHLPPIEFEHHHRQARTETPDGRSRTTHPPTNPGRFKVWQRRLTPDPVEVESWLRGLPQPVKVTYEAGLAIP